MKGGYQPLKKDSRAEKKREIRERMQDVNRIVMNREKSARTDNCKEITREG